MRASACSSRTRPKGCRARGRNRYRSAVAPLHARDFAAGRTPLRASSGDEVRDAAPRIDAEGRGTPLERRTRASPRAQRARHRRNRARRRPARRLGADDPHVPGACVRSSPDFVHPEAGAHASRVDSGHAHPRSRAGRPHARADRPQHRADARRHVGRRVARQSPWTATTATIRSSSRTSRGPSGRSCRRCAASSGSAAELLPDDGQPRRRGRGDDVGRRLHARTPSVVLISENFAQRVLEGAVGGGRPAHPQQTPRDPGGRSSASSATSATTARRSRANDRSTGR